MIDSACNRRSGAAAGEIRKRGDAVITERMMGGSGKGLMFRGISAGANGAGHSRASQSADHPRGRLRRAAAAWLLACAALLALPALPGLGGGVAHADVLVNNIGQTAGISPIAIQANFPRAQAFTTGSNSAGYALDSVGVSLNSTPPTASYFSVSIHESSGGDPGNLRYTLSNPSTFATGVNVFTAPAKASLEGGTTYFVVIGYQHPMNQSEQVRLRTTASDDEDAAGEDDWSIANSSEFVLSGTWTTYAESLKIRVNGSPRAAITDIDIETEPTAIGSFPGFHGTGDFIQVRVTFSRDVLGTPESGVASLKLLVGGKERTAQAQFTQLPLGSFVFAYGIQADDVDLDGITVPADALALPQGGALQDTDGVDVVLTHVAYEFPTHLVNPPVPEITNIEVASDVPDHGFHSSALGDVVEFRVTFSEAVTASGNQALFRLAVRVGDDDVGATYIEGSGTTQLTFILVYNAQHTDPDGVSVPADSLSPGTGPLKGPYGQDAVLTHRAYGPFTGHLINTPPPPAHFTGIEVDSSPGSGGFYATGDTIELHVIFSGRVTTGGNAPGTPPDVALKLRVGGAERSAEYLLGSGTSKLRFLYTVQAGDEDRDGVSVPANALSLGTGMTLKDQYGQDVVSTHGARGFPDHLVNSAPPPRGITGIDVVSPLPDAGFYATGDTIELHVIFSGPVTTGGNALGTPPDVALKLRVGNAERSAAYLLGSGTSKLRFLYTVQAGDEDRDGVSGPANALSLGTGMTLKGPYGQDADLTYGAYGPFRHARVNFEAAPPSAPTNLAVTADNENEVLFRWEPPADDGGAPVTRYAYRYDANEDGVFTGWAYVGSTPKGQPPRRSWGIDVEADGDRVCVQVMAVNVANFLIVPEVGNLEGEPTQARCAVPYGPAEGAPEAPGWLRVTSTQADRADLEWGEPDESGNSPLWGYRIEVSTDGGGNWREVEANTGEMARRWSDAGVDDLANRLYRVSAVNTAYDGAGNPSPSASLAPMTLEPLRTKPAQHFENEGDERASSHSVAVTVELTNPAPGRRVHVRLIHEGRVVEAQVLDPAGTSVAVTFGGLPERTHYSLTADVVASFDSPEARWDTVQTLGDIRQGAGPGRGVEVDTDGDGVAEADPRLTVAMGAAANIRVRPGACTGAKNMVVHGSLTQFGVHRFGPIVAEASPGGHRWSCADGGDPGEWRAIELTVERHADAMLAAPFEVGVRHDVYTQRPAHQSWQPVVLQGSLVRLEVEASQTLAPVTGLAVEADDSDRPRVSWDAVAGAGAYQVQWRWGSEAYGRWHKENGATSSREKRVTGTSHAVAAPAAAKRAEGLTVRVRAYDGAALTVGPWREAVLGAKPGRPSELTVTPDSTTAIRLAWEAAAANGARILGYGIEVSDDGARSWETLVEDTVSTATGYVHRSLAPGSQRFYRVRARNGAGTGAWSHLAGTSTLRSGQASGALTAQMNGLPERHDGSGAVRFKMAFSEPVTAGEDAVRRHALSVTNGTVSEASRREDEPGAYDMKVMPDSGREVTIVLPGGRPCAETGAICTGDGRRLAHALSMSVPGPAAASGASVLAGFVLVDAASGADLGAVADGATVRVADPSGGSYDFRVETAAGAAVGSVRLALAGPEDGDAAARADDAAPYLLRGGTDGTGAGAALPAGSYTLTATAYAGPGGTGAALGSLSVAFKVAPTVLSGFVLVDATAHADLGAVEDGARLTELDAAKVYGFRAEAAANGGVESVTLALSGPGPDDEVSRTENYAPWSLYGDSAGNEHGAALGDGAYTLTAMAWSGKKGEGAALQTLRVSFTVGEAQVAPAAEPLSAEFEHLPGSHIGSGTWFNLRVVFSEPVTIGEEAFAAHALILGNATVREAWRVEGAPGEWRVKIAPASDAQVTVALAAGRACAEEGALCTADGRALESAPEASIAGPKVLTGFELVDLSAGGQRTTLESGATVRLADASGGNYDIVAKTAAGRTVGSVAFVLDAPGEDNDVTHTEGVSPWSLHGDGGEDAINGAPLRAGSHTLTATAWSEPGGAGTVLGTLSVSFTVEAAQETAPAAATLTATFVGMPSEHGGEGVTFTFEVHFDPEPRVSYKVLRDESFAVTGGTVEKARRVKGRNDRREIHVKPTGMGAITVRLAGGRACGAAGAICTAGGGVLSNSPSATVAGPPALSVADATANESEGSIAFAVTLDRAAPGTVTVAYETRDGSASAGHDYTGKTGTLSFAAGQTSKSVSVALLDDAVDDGGETFELVLSNPVGAVIADGAATGTIENSDPMPSAWLARFGRTVTGQVLDAVETRLRAPRAAGATVSLAGQNIGLTAQPDAKSNAETEAEKESRTRLGVLWDWLRQETEDRERAGIRSRTLTASEVLMGSSFALAAETDSGGSVAVWGRMAQSSFSGREGGLSLDGDVTTGLLGADYAKGPWTGGAVLSHSSGEGGYSGEAAGKVEASMTALTPWAGYKVTERLSVWGALGYGAGDLKLTQENPQTQEDQPAQKTDIAMTLAAAGVRVTVVDGDGPKLDAVTDARWVRTTSEKVTASADDGGNLAASASDVTRLRLGLEGSWAVALDDKGATMTPRLSFGVRHDGGDAEAGFGADIGGGVTLAMPARGVSVSLEVRGLLTHEAKGFSDTGFSGTIAWDPAPSSKRGLSLSLRQSVGGSATGGKNALFSREVLDGLAANGNSGGSRRLEGRIGYGLAVYGDRFTGTPEIGFGLSDSGRDYSLGWRLTREGRDAGSFEFALEATRRESENDIDPEHGIGFRLTARW